jgi:hypothetical protein
MAEQTENKFWVVEFPGMLVVYDVVMAAETAVRPFSALWHQHSFY